MNYVTGLQRERERERGESKGNNAVAQKEKTDKKVLCSAHSASWNNSCK